MLLESQLFHTYNMYYTFGEKFANFNELYNMKEFLHDAERISGKKFTTPYYLLAKICLVLCKKNQGQRLSH